MQVHKSGSSKTYQDSNRNNEGHSTGRISEHFEDDDSPVQTRAVRGRRKPQSGSLMALTNEVESDERSYPDPRKRRMASVRQKDRKDQISSLSIPRSGSLYGTLPRKPRKPRSPIPEIQPLIRRSTLSKENVSLEESDVSPKHRTFSSSPVRKAIRKKPPSSLEIKKGL